MGKLWNFCGLWSMVPLEPVAVVMNLDYEVSTCISHFDWVILDKIALLIDAETHGITKGKVV